MKPLVRLEADTAARRSRRRQRYGARSESVEVRLEPDERGEWIKAAAREGYLTLSDWIRDKCNRAASMRVLMSSVRTDWNTPGVVIDVLELLGEIALDPCSNDTSIVPAWIKWDKAADGLSRSWLRAWMNECARRRRPGFVFVNPPYGDAIGDWIDKALEEARQGVPIVLLLPARVDTQWFGRLGELADVALWKGRLRFLDAPSTAPFPVCLAFLNFGRASVAAAVRKRCGSIIPSRSSLRRGRRDRRSRPETNPRRTVRRSRARGR